MSINRTGTKLDIQPTDMEKLIQLLRASEGLRQVEDTKFKITVVKPGRDAYIAKKYLREIDQLLRSFPRPSRKLEQSDLIWETN